MVTTTNRLLNDSLLSGHWLPLAEYSIKHRVSISTLRRRIKTEDIKFRFDDGKYHLLDTSPKKEEKKANNPEPRPSLNSDSQQPAQQPVQQPAQQIESSNEARNEAGQSVISAANRLLAELKKAYTQILLEKEEQILQLREETMDLKTLIKVLESENTRLRN